MPIHAAPAAILRPPRVDRDRLMKPPIITVTTNFRCRQGWSSIRSRLHVSSSHLLPARSAGCALDVGRFGRERCQQSAGSKKGRLPEHIVRSDPAKQPLLVLESFWRSRPDQLRRRRIVDGSSAACSVRKAEARAKVLARILDLSGAPAVHVADEPSSMLSSADPEAFEQVRALLGLAQIVARRRPPDDVPIAVGDEMRAAFRAAEDLGLGAADVPAGAPPASALVRPYQRPAN